MDESKIELTERLRGEGRWNEAAKFKETARADFRTKGMKRAEAVEAAWEAMAEAYPPLPVMEATADAAAIAPDATTADASAVPIASVSLPPQSTKAAEVDVDALLDRSGDQPRPDLVRDVLWAYENLSNRRVKPIDAPGAGAWAMLEWARQYRNRFFEQVLPKAMNARSQEDEDAANIRRERMALEEIDELLREANSPWAEELAANAPETIRAKVRSILEDWACRSALTIPGEAKADLEGHISRLVDDCLDILAPLAGGE